MSEQRQHVLLSYFSTQQLVLPGIEPRPTAPVPNKMGKPGGSTDTVILFLTLISGQLVKHIPVNDRLSAASRISASILRKIV